MNRKKLKAATCVTGHSWAGGYRLKIDAAAVPELEPWRDLDAKRVSNVRAGYIIINAIRAAVIAGKGKNA